MINKHLRWLWNLSLLNHQYFFHNRNIVEITQICVQKDGSFLGMPNSPPITICDNVFPSPVVVGDASDYHLLTSTLLYWSTHFAGGSGFTPHETPLWTITLAQVKISTVWGLLDKKSDLFTENLSRTGVSTKHIKRLHHNKCIYCLCVVQSSLNHAIKSAGSCATVVALQTAGPMTACISAAAENLPAPITVAAEQVWWSSWFSVGKYGILMKERVGGVKQLHSKDGVTKGWLGLVSINTK